MIAQVPVKQAPIIQVNKPHKYEVRDLFPLEMLTKMGISYLLNVEKTWNSAQLNLSPTLNFYQKYMFEATIFTEKSSSEIDADLAQMKCNYT